MLDLNNVNIVPTHISLISLAVRKIGSPRIVRKSQTLSLARLQRHKLRDILFTRCDVKYASHLTQNNLRVISKTNL